MIKELGYLVIIAVAIPLGLFLKKICRDEIGNWKKRFTHLTLLSLLIATLILFSSIEYKQPLITTLLFIVLLLQTINYKKRNKN